MDKINVTIECGGYRITGVAGDIGSHIYADDKTKSAWFGNATDPLLVWTGSGNLGAANFFYIESDTPGKLHRFRGIEYLGEVDAPRDYCKMLQDLLDRFDGANIIRTASNSLIIVHKNKAIWMGCEKVYEIIGAHNTIQIAAEYGIEIRYISRKSVSDAMVTAARNSGLEFTNTYERLMKI